MKDYKTLLIYKPPNTKKKMKETIFPWMGKVWYTFRTISCSQENDKNNLKGDL